MPPDPTPPLPLAANRAALSNRISMLLASQSSVLKTMNLTRAPASISARRPPDADDDPDLLRGSRANEGVGYVPEAKDTPTLGNARELRMLRGGKKAARRGDGRSLRKDESESEDDVGRSALGKRKRPPRAAGNADVAGAVPLAEADVEANTGDNGVPVVVPPVAEVTADEAVNDAVQDVKDGNEGGEKKRKKNKKKKPMTAIA
ncbi:hypothetical protein B0J13DRAFT_89730 [Dactylonectria estremocensis]|uniref:Uncharacterized protein n=1 Tax=Dactylonectria estremocensis TaxID=1079267 RepID=A0A9P9ECT3_9HYPO|nr:hypothetical protein B0J13DRAFT_89730 [Dactylonectria estremocensis]